MMGSRTQDLKKLGTLYDNVKPFNIMGTLLNYHWTPTQDNPKWSINIPVDFTNISISSQMANLQDLYPVGKVDRHTGTGL